MSGGLSAAELTRGELPGRTPIVWRRNRSTAVPLACLAGALWPPLFISLAILPPTRWLPHAGGLDWRILAIVVALIAVPVGVRILGREHDRTGKPATRLGVVWRFLVMGGVLAAGLQLLIATVMLVMNAIASQSVGNALGSIETTVLIYGVAGLPFALMVGISHALWAGLCVAFIAFQKRPPSVRPRMGLMSNEG